MQEELCCEICGNWFFPYDGMRTIQRNNELTAWCQTDQDIFDQIDWEAVNERRDNCNG